MKRKLPAILICAAVLMLCLFWVWYGRPQAFVDVFPVPLGDVDYCSVQLTNLEDVKQYDTGRLNQGQIEQVLQAFYGQELRQRHSDLDGVPDGHQSSMDWVARIYLMDQDVPEDRCELMLMGDYLVVSETHENKSRTYTLSGGTQFQLDLIQRLLTFCSPAEQEI